MYAEVIGLIPNWVSGEKGAGGHTKNLHLCISEGRKETFSFLPILFEVNFAISSVILHQLPMDARALFLSGRKNVL